VPKTFDSFFIATFIGKVFRCSKYLAIFEVPTAMLLKITSCRMFLLGWKIVTETSATLYHFSGTY
jgi:hypothetical protein